MVTCTSRAGAMLALLLASLACASVHAGRVSPEQAAPERLATPPAALATQHTLHPLISTSSDSSVSGRSAAGADDADNKKKKKKGSSDYEDSDPDVRSHWALLVAGSAGWYNYRHQADVYHAYQLLLAGGYHRDHIVVMAADDLAHDPENPMPGKVFNRPGGPDVYEGVAIDYRGADVTSDTFLAVLLGDAAKVAGKGSGRVVASGPRDKVFVFYSDHGAAGVLGMPNGPFLYADEFIKTLKKKRARAGFKEAVLYIEACESGSMFEGLLGNDLDIYVTTAANAIESSWATYCPTFGLAEAAAQQQQTTPAGAVAAGSGAPSNGGGGSTAGGSAGGSNGSSWGRALLRGAAWLQRQLRRWTGAPQGAGSSSGSSSGSGGRTGGAIGPQPPTPTPTFTTCLGDLYSVAWMENAEAADLTAETLLEQYKRVKVRTSQNFTYEQGSHVMQYGDLDIDRELAGDYEGSLHNGSSPTPSTAPSHEWTEFAARQQQQRRRTAGAAGGSAAAPALLLQQYASPAALLHRLQAAAGGGGGEQRGAAVEQRDADLVPLAAAATARGGCPHRRAVAAAALRRATAARQGLEAAARRAVAALLRQPGTGHGLMAALGWVPQHVLPGAAPGALAALAAGGATEPSAAAAGAAAAHSQQQQQHGVMREPSLLLGDVRGEYVELLLGPLPGRQGRPLVDSWECLRGMVQAWEGQCGQLDQYSMKLTRLFANLCNAGVGQHALGASLAAAAPCGPRV